MCWLGKFISENWRLNQNFALFFLKVFKLVYKEMSKARNVNDYLLERKRLQTYTRTIWIKAKCSQNKIPIYRKALSIKNWLKSPNLEYLLILDMQFFKITALKIIACKKTVFANVVLKRQFTSMLGYKI